MIFERVKSEGIAHFSYFIGSGEEAAVIDPRRDSEVYLNLAREEDVGIKYIFETHRNEDYAIGSIELGHHTEAEIYHSPTTPFRYGKPLEDGQEFFFGKAKLTALFTPGHTYDSVSYVLADVSRGNHPIRVFTVDTLFVGEVGRTDMFGKEESSRLSGELYDSLYNRLLPLGDGVIVCPAHGQGSLCGDAIGEQEESTIGLERLLNPALQKSSRDDFIRQKTAEQLEIPPYFRIMERLNLEGPPPLGQMPAPPSLHPQELEAKSETGALILDTRSPISFGSAHIKGSYSIWLDGVPSYAGWFLPYDREILLVLDRKEDLRRAVPYLVRIGYDNLGGYLGRGFSEWLGEGLRIDSLDLLSVHDLESMIKSAVDLLVLDVRTNREWRRGHIKNAIHVHFGHVLDQMNQIPTDRRIAVICSSGSRASIAASVLKNAGYERICNVIGGMTAWQSAGLPTIK